MSKPVVLYRKNGRVAELTLNRPDRLNAINEEMPSAIAQAVATANADPDIHVLLLQGAGRAFCSGYDLKQFAETPRPTLGSQDMPWDPLIDYQWMSEATRNFMSLWRSLKPTVAKVHGFAVAGGSDIALCCDLVIMEETAKIGYPPARIWGCPTTAMWIYRIGAERAKRMLLTGDLISGTEAKAMGLVIDAVPADQLDGEVDKLLVRMASVPKNQLMMQKLMVNQAYENMGLASTQMIATLFDGITRHSPEGIAFKDRCEQVGFNQAVAERDRGDPLGWQNHPKD